MAQNTPPYPFKKIVIKSKTMRQITKTPFLKRLNKALAVSMRLEQSQKYSQSQSLTEVTLLECSLIKISFKPLD
ncbi:hypothetical protein JT067_01760 [Helicobacter pylori]|nr:hypothetical protein [Helicobacter pylori]